VDRKTDKMCFSGASVYFFFFVETRNNKKLSHEQTKCFKKIEAKLKPENGSDAARGSMFDFCYYQHIFLKNPKNHYLKC